MNCFSSDSLSGLGTIKILWKAFSYNFKKYVENRLENFLHEKVWRQKFSKNKIGALEMTRIFKYKVWRGKIYYLFNSKIIRNFRNYERFFDHYVKRQKCRHQINFQYAAVYWSREIAKNHLKNFQIQSMARQDLLPL